MFLMCLKSNNTKITKKILSAGFSILFPFLFVLSASAQTGSQQFRQASGIFRVAEPGQLADSINVWGDVPNTGRFLIPEETTLPQLMSYAGGPRGLNNDLFNLSKVKIRVNISRYMGPNNQRSVVENFEFAYKDPVPAELYRFNLQNNDIVSIEVRRRPNFLDYLQIIGPIVSTIFTLVALRRLFE